MIFMLSGRDDERDTACDATHFVLWIVRYGDGNIIPFVAPMDYN